MNNALPHPGIAILTTNPLSTEADMPFSKRMESVRPELSAYARRLLPPGQSGALPHLDHEDLVQDTLARALIFQANFDKDRPLVPWLKRMLLRLFLDHRKRALASPSYKRPGQSTPPAEELSGDSKPTSHGHRDDVEEAEFLLAQLEDPERTILDRFYRGGQSVAEIGLALGLPPGTVKSHLHRARLRLRERALEQGTKTYARGQS